MKAFALNRAVSLVLSVLLLRDCTCNASVCGEKFTISQKCMKKYGNILAHFPTPSQITCANACKTNTACLSAVFDPQAMSCTINAGKAAMFGKHCDYKMDYMTLESSSCRSVQFGDCDLAKKTGECSVTNSRCYNDTCECIRGYSYSLSEGACVEYCETYGDTFTKITDYYIQGSDPTVLYMDLDAVLAWCIHETDGFMCRTVEYTPGERKGTLSPYRAIESNLRKRKNTDIYQRNCA